MCACSVCLLPQVNARTFLEKRYSEDMELEDAVHTALLTLKEGFEGAAWRRCSCTLLQSALRGSSDSHSMAAPCSDEALVMMINHAHAWFAPVHCACLQASCPVTTSRWRWWARTACYAC